MDMISFLVCEVGNRIWVSTFTCVQCLTKGLGCQVPVPLPPPWIASRGIITFSLGRIGQLPLLVHFQLHTKYLLLTRSCS